MAMLPLLPLPEVPAVAPPVVDPPAVEPAPVEPGALDPVLPALDAPLALEAPEPIRAFVSMN